jgi:hypothetical protein
VVDGHALVGISLEIALELREKRLAVHLHLQHDGRAPAGAEEARCAATLK